MSGKYEELKGRIKEAAGALTDDAELREEGKADQVLGKVKKHIQEAADQAKEIAEAAAKKIV
jgi:uncharacterized protein YjbJ (UPF0337 family)